MQDSYLKAVLYAYPKLRDVAEATAVSAENKAALSYKSYLDPLALMEGIAEEFLTARALFALSELLDDAISLLTEEEKFLLEYRFFRRKKYLRQMCAQRPFIFSQRSYFRRQVALLRKIRNILAARFFTEKEFFARFSSCEFLMTLYRAAERGERQAFPALPIVQKSARSASGCGRFPRRTKTATATAAAQAIQIAAIPAGERPLSVSSADGEGR